MLSTLSTAEVESLLHSALVGLSVKAYLLSGLWRDFRGGGAFSPMSGGVRSFLVL